MATRHAVRKGKATGSQESRRATNGVLPNIKAPAASIRNHHNRTSKSSDSKAKRTGDINEASVTRGSYSHLGRYGRSSHPQGAVGGLYILPGVHAVPTAPLEDDLPLEEFFQLAETLLLEYFVHGSTREVAERLDDILTGPLRPYVVSVVVEISLGHKCTQRELTSMLISDLYGRVLTGKDIERGFTELLRNLPELMLDTPTAPTMLGNFMARAITDDCLPPRFVMKSGAVDELSEPALAALDNAYALIHTKHGWANLSNVWSVGGPMSSVSHLKQQIQIILKRYLSSGDLEEALSSISALEVPHFHHEVVFAIIVRLLESLRACTALGLCNLLKALDKYCVVSGNCMELGFRRVIEELPEIVLDVPTAYVIFGDFMQRCCCAGLIMKELLNEMPTQHSSLLEQVKGTSSVSLKAM